MNTSRNNLRNTALVAAAILMLAVSALLMAGATHAWFTASITSKGNTITAVSKWPDKSGQQPVEGADEQDDSAAEVTEGPTSVEEPGSAVDEDDSSSTDSAPASSTQTTSDLGFSDQPDISAGAGQQVEATGPSDPAVTEETPPQGE